MAPTEDEEKEWSACCSRTNKDFIKYITQVSFGAALAIFSMAQISRGVPNQEIYWSTLAATVGTFMPHPTMIKTKP